MVPPPHAASLAFPPSAAEVERAAADALAPATDVRDDAWRLRADPAGTRRGNSVLAEGAGRDPLPRKIARAERFCRTQGSPPRFQLSPASRPVGLGAELERRGYALEPGARVLVAGAAWIARRRAGSGELAVALASVPGSAHRALRLAVAGGRGEADDPAAHAARLAEKGATALYAVARDAGAPVATGVAVIDRCGDLAGLFRIGTRPEARRRGAGRAVTAALADACARRGVGTLYLQVGAGNTAAERLYASLGFAEFYRYRYRVLER